MLHAMTRVATLGLTVLTAWLAARGAGETMLQALGEGVDFAAGAAPPPAAVNESPATLPVSHEELLASNLFALPPEPGPSAPEDPAPQPAVSVAFGGSPAPCTLPLRVVALVAVQGGISPAALAAVERSGTTVDVRVGDHLDDAVVTRIAWNRLFLRRPGEPDECYLDIRDPAAPAVAARPPPPEQPPLPERKEPATSEDRFERAVARSIDELGEGEFAVSRTLLDTVLEEPELAARAMRVLPARDGEAIVGFRLLGVRRDTLPGKLGLQNGDVVAAINGLPMTSMDAVMRAYGLLRMADEITVEVLRRGERVALMYHLR
jgi:general secretion pathway protein C